ncbi:SUN family RNA methylase [Cryptosporidium ubiquitum]|uniref:SUN family RNA methylase n=1 Tax=Cryptosporidium ubiquitum TaxID=857276 RepID=A0A1J4MKR2_9CRYT|nr:SUN family RNA methylase [Cryptosporidium ubiquitum]OII74035.1 SUN family RNA methylase [Cryptosporidium ubiquitum]
MEERGGNNKRRKANLERSEFGSPSLEVSLKDKESYTLIERFNSRFENYYRLQQICPEKEFQDFMNSLSSPLPTSLRVNVSHSLHSLLEFLLILESEKLLNETKADDNSPIFKEKRLSKNSKSYLLNQYSRKMLKRESRLAKFHDLIVSQDEFGTLSSQELVSMLPCICLDPKPGHSILDLCSAPGSKSTQILDVILSSRNNQLGLSLQKGLFICNDVSSKRLDTLSSRLARIPSPNVLITCIDASFFPSFKPSTSNNTCFFKFDRILVDSPCSGDGTLRKNLDIWTTWKPEKALSLHKKQISLLSRAFKLLKYGGRLVYSTCSLNPIENEAVISTLMKQFPEAKLIEPSNLDESELSISRGLKTWGVYCDLKEQNETQLFFTLDSVPETSFKKSLTQSMFPTKEWSESGNFMKCFRILPHKNDTGGFFFAIIEKEGVKYMSQTERGFKSSSCKYENVELDDLELILSFYGLCNQSEEGSNGDFESFPLQIRSHLKNVEFLEKSSLVKRKSYDKTIYLIGKDVSQLICNYNLELDIRSVGIRAFEYLKGRISGEGKCKWRINQISSNYLVRLMKRRLVFVSVSLLDLLDDENRFIEGIKILDLESKGELLGLKELCSETSGEKKLESGGILVVILPPSVLKYGGSSKVNPSFQEFYQGVPLSGILYKDSGISLFVSKNEIKSIKQLILI